MTEKIIPVKGIGLVTFKKNKRSKALTISIRPIKGITVNMPFYVPYSEALRIVEFRREWIENNLPKIKKIEEKVTVFTEKTTFNTRTRTLNISSYNGEKFTAQLTHNSIDLKYPVNHNVNQTNIQELIRKSILWAIKTEAREYLPQRIKAFSIKHSFSYNKLFLKNNKTNWGSCSAKNNINLNIHLVRLPDYLIDYVIIHELCHTLEKNHSERFWLLLSRFISNPKQLSKELRTYSTHIY